MSHIEDIDLDLGSAPTRPVDRKTADRRPVQRRQDLDASDASNSVKNDGRDGEIDQVSQRNKSVMTGEGYDLSEDERGESLSELNSQEQSGFELPRVLSRSLARSVDCLWQAIPVLWLLHVVLPYQNQLTWPRFILLVVLALPLVLLLDALVQGVFGNTPGKKLLGLQAVTWRGRQLSISESFERNFLIWRFGFLFGLVPLIPLTVVREWLQVKNGQRTRYDEQLHLRIKIYTRPAWLVLLAALVAVGIVIIAAHFKHDLYGSTNVFHSNMLGASRLDDDTPSVSAVDQSENTGLPILLSTSAGSTNSTSVNESTSRASTTSAPRETTRAWTNPYTGLSTVMDDQWQATASVDGDRIEIRHIETSSMLTLTKIGEGELDLERLARQFLAATPEFGAGSILSKVQLAGNPGERVRAPSRQGDFLRASEWISVDGNVFRLEQVWQPSIQKTFDRVKATVWSTFI